MKEAELRECATCALCRRKIMESGLPLFWRVTIELFGIDVAAAKRQDGLAAMLGSSALASVMGTDDDLAKPMMDPVKISVCESCCTDPQCVAHLVELGEK